MYRRPSAPLTSASCIVRSLDEGAEGLVVDSARGGVRSTIADAAAAATSGVRRSRSMFYVGEVAEISARSRRIGDLIVASECP